MADEYVVEDFCVVFDRSKNLHFIEVRESVEKPLPKEFNEQYFTRQDFAKVAISNYCKATKQSKGK